jgi:hypothetical protein
MESIEICQHINKVMILKFYLKKKYNMLTNGFRIVKMANILVFLKKKYL